MLPITLPSPQEPIVDLVPVVLTVVAARTAG
jgi:hypothetical protein